MRRRFLLTLAAIVLTVIMAISYRAILSDAKETDDVIYKYYTSIEVQYGDTLWSIAQAYYSEEYDSVDDYIYEVMKINHLQQESVITAGSHLVVPYFSTELK
ncbi:MAG: LysM peptidoglycan-binding domain-containing protein [Lachnospiraceae bacterium]|nr:LysM peptidoglycan-binding domain-containing protein [Lachnospiraceae bacterium]